MPFVSSQPLVMIVEDEAIVALDLGDELEAAGFTVAGPLVTCLAASAWLGENTPTAAILDVDLQDGPCYELARSLQTRDVPIVFYSGRSRHNDLPPDLKDVPWLDKPAKPTDIVRALQLTLPVAG